MNELTVPYGQLTFDAEGNDDPNSRYFSRVAHVPPGGSGVTIGRGYDLGNFTQSKVEEGLVQAGIDPTPWRGAYGKKSADAQSWYEANKGKLGEITREQQKKLFIYTYDDLKADVVRISTKADVLKVYGKTDFATLDPRILDVVVDLRYRGDYSGATRKRVQPCMVKNDVEGLAQVMADRSFWNSVPQDRFQRRKDFLAGAKNDGSATANKTTVKPATHVVESGETLEKLSARFGVSVDGLKQANKSKLKTWGTVQGFNAGETITIP